VSIKDRRNGFCVTTLAAMNIHSRVQHMAMKQKENQKCQFSFHQIVPTTKPTVSKATAPFLYHGTEPWAARNVLNDKRYNCHYPSSPRFAAFGNRAPTIAQSCATVITSAPGNKHSSSSGLALDDRPRASTSLFIKSAANNSSYKQLIH